MLARFSAALLLALVVTACTGEDADTAETTTSTTGDPTTTSTTSTTVPAVVASVESGRLVVVDAGNVVVVSPDGSERIAITTDAGEAGYSQPIWSPDSEMLSYTEITPEGFGVQINGAEGGSPTTVPMANPPFYMNWAPGGTHIGVLHNGLEGLDFQMVDVSEGTSALLDRGAPFYFSWSPEGDRVVIHEGADRFETIAPGGERAELGETSAGYLVPQWLPQGIVHVDGDVLTLMGEESEETALAEVTGQSAFVANPQGTMVAVQSLSPDDEFSVALGDPIPSNSVAVVDLDSGQIDVADDRPSIGFWWSPDGESLLVLRPTPDRPGGDVTPIVWSAGDGSVQEFQAYNPSPVQMRDLFPFFPQYAQSMTFWSPDSAGFAVAGEIDDRVGIWVHAIGATVPRFVSEGTWVAWSH